MVNATPAANPAVISHNNLFLKKEGTLLDDISVLLWLLSGIQINWNSKLIINHFYQQSV
jgi:hypothetical protein